MPLLDLLGNELKEQDLVCIKVTEQVVGRIVKLDQGGTIGTKESPLGVPGHVLILVEVHRLFDPKNPRADLIKVVEPKKDKIN